MKIAVISDVHLGYAWGTERGNDPFDALEEAMEKVLSCDLILIPGDMFDSRKPGIEVFSGAMKTLLKARTSSSDVQLVEGLGKNTEPLMPLASMGIPIVAIHGTHERRVKGLVNPIEALERAGFLIYLHCNGVVLRKGEEKVAVQGMSGVPDQYAESVMRKWNPAPIKGAFNILMLHQSLAPFMHARHLMPVECLPEGFDLYINGHIHDSRQEKYAGSPLLIPGSFIPTQLTKEAVQSRGFWIIDTNEIPPRFRFMELENQRKVYHRSFKGDMSREMMIEELKNLTQTPYKKKPIIRINFTGKPVPDNLISDLRARFSDMAILSFKKEAEDMPAARSLEEQRLSVQEMGRQALLKNLSEFRLDSHVFESVFELLLEKKDEEAIDLLSRNMESKA